MIAFPFKKHILILALILIFSFVIRIYNIDKPSEYVFDEIYYAATAKLMMHNDPRVFEQNPIPQEKNTWIDWTHPPLAKYFQAGSMLIFGENAFGWRFSAVVFGVLVILMTYLLAYKLFNNQTIALLSAALASLDGLLLTQSRIAMNDIFLAFFTLLCFYAYQHYRKSGRAYHLILASIFAGLAIVTKWSGVFTLSIIAFFEFFKFIKLIFIDKEKHPSLIMRWILVRFLCFVFIPVIVYIVGYLPLFFQGRDLHFLLDLQSKMMDFHLTMKTTHTYSSKPFAWFMNMRPVWMYVKYSPDGYRADIYGFGNPALFVFGVFSVFASLVYLSLAVYKYVRTEILNTASAPERIFKKLILVTSTNSFLFLLLCYFAVWIPWQLSPRISYFYYYTSAVPLLSILIGYWVYNISKMYKWIRYFVLGTVLIAFILWYPHWVGIPVSNKWAESVYFYFPQWK